MSDPVDELPVVLQKGERLIWRNWNTEYAEIRPYTFHVGSSSGFSIRLGKGLYYRRSAFKGYPVTVTGPQLMGSGILYVTDRNLYFFSFNKTVRISYDKVISLLPAPRRLCHLYGWKEREASGVRHWRWLVRLQPVGQPHLAAPRRGATPDPRAPGAGSP